MRIIGDGGCKYGDQKTSFLWLYENLIVTDLPSTSNLKYIFTMYINFKIKTTDIFYIHIDSEKSSRKEAKNFASTMAKSNNNVIISDEDFKRTRNFETELETFACFQYALPGDIVKKKKKQRKIW